MRAADVMIAGAAFLVMGSFITAIGAFVAAEIAALRASAIHHSGSGSNRLALLVWPFAARRLNGDAQVHALTAHKAMVAFFSALLLFCAAFAVLTNLLRVVPR